ncbi:HupE/UreJ family protein [Bradyrhizobium sp. McL0616]|uniref:HupE/UreJ family protein n=1 Tax=Bradyrhizobium sp. McL0616 TaxID=3415674 RepID=UPI003CF4BAF5
MKLLMARSVFLGIVFAICALLQSASAHESRPAYMQVTEIAPKRYEFVWRTPLLSGMRLPVVLRLPNGARNVTEPTLRELSDSLVERRLIELDSGLTGARIEMVGLQATITDVLVRVQLLDGSFSTTLVRPSKPWIEIATSRSALEVATAYLTHGIEHILFGYDHLLFVLALILIVRRGRVLLITVTAFTIAHSITLSLATLGLVHVAGPPVEATIALSILLLAWEIIRSDRGQTSLTAQWPWLVAFSFGLLHGFGFASALSEIGLPQGDIPLALFAFNVGVEAGQLMFIAAVLGFLRLSMRIKFPIFVQRYARPATTYAIGIMAAYWLIERLASFSA